MSRVLKRLRLGFGTCAVIAVSLLSVVPSACADCSMDPCPTGTIIASPALAVRDRPALDATAIGKLLYGEKVSIWHQERVNNQSGRVDGPYGPTDVWDLITNPYDPNAYYPRLDPPRHRISSRRSVARRFALHNQRFLPATRQRLPVTALGRAAHSPVPSRSYM